MSPIIAYEDCLSDSPRFRSQLGINESNLEDMEQRLDKVIKLSTIMTEGGKQYVTQQTQFLASLWELSSYFANERGASILTPLNKLIHALQEIVKLQNGLVDMASKSVTKNLTRFIKEDVKQMKDTKGYFNKISTDLDSALQKNSSASKSRPSDVEDTSNLLTATQSCFRYTTLDYVYQISMLQSRKKHEVLEALLGCVKSYGVYFRQGHALFDGDLNQFTSELGDEILEMKKKTATLEKHLEKRHTQVSLQGDSSPNVQTVGDEVKIEGYLFKRGQNAFRTWNRRWFYLKDNKLCYAKRSGEDVTIMEEDLRICLVRPLMDIDRRFCFEVISPTKSHVLQGDSDEISKNWIATLQQGISSALQMTISGEKEETNTRSLQWEDSDPEDHDGTAGAAKSKTLGKSGSKSKRSAKQILLIPGNEKCCDCGSPDPKWASINLGITLCISCSGVHRSLGVHISKVRSITLDAWEPEILKVMAELGNQIVNKIYEANVHEIVAKRATPDCGSPERENWIKAKYVAKAFIRSDLLNSDSGEKSGNTGRWTVRRLRRRARTGGSSMTKKKQQSAKEKLDKDDKDVDTTAVIDPVPEAAAVDQEKADPSSPKINAEEILFGMNLGKHHVANIELDSDQESTDGEEESDSALLSSEILLAKLTPHHLLYRAARVHNLPVMNQALALGANPDWISPDGSAVIHQSILSGSVMACEYLLLNGAKINLQDFEGNTSLHQSALHGNTGQICLLLKHRANHHLRNKENKKALDIAVQNSDADIVTLLRLAALNEEIRENDATGGDDDTFNDVVQEFSQMVYTHPERLNKKSESGPGTPPPSGGGGGAKKKH